MHATETALELTAAMEQAAQSAFAAMSAPDTLADSVATAAKAPPQPGSVPKLAVPQVEMPSQITVSGVFGEIVWLLTQSPVHKNLFLSDMEWLVMTPILLQQFRVFHAHGRPVGVAFWGYLSEEGEQRLQSGGGRLAPADWKAGDRLWLVEIVAPFGGANEMVKDLSETALKGKKFKHLHLDETCQKVVKEVG